MMFQLLQLIVAVVRRTLLQYHVSGVSTSLSLYCSVHAEEGKGSCGGDLAVGGRARSQRRWAAGQIRRRKGGFLSTSNPRVGRVGTGRVRRKVFLLL